MITYAQALLLGLLQGIAELFPISSLGHSVLVPALLHWNIDEHAPYFLTFLVATHFATALVLLAFFAKDWLKIIQGFFRSLLNRGIPVGDTYARLSWVIIVATVPAGIIGLLFQSKIQALLAAPTIVALFLVLNGALLYTIEEVQKGRARFFTAMTSGDVAIARLPWPYAAVTGLAQAIALLPGFSRTGASLGGGLLVGLDHESAARFSFLLATPIILAAAVLKLPELFMTHGYPVPQILVGALAAAAGAAFSTFFLLQFFRSNTMRPFAFYCIAAGAVSLVLLTR